MDVQSINEMANHYDLINRLSRANEAEIATEHQTTVIDANPDVRAMSEALKALEEAERIAIEESTGIVEEHTYEVEHIQEDIKDNVNNIEGYTIKPFTEGNDTAYSLSVGGLQVISKSYSHNALKRLSTLLESGRTFEHPEVSNLIRNIGKQVAIKNSLKESKKLYQQAKRRGNITLMVEYKQDFIDGKKLLEDISKRLI